MAVNGRSILVPIGKVLRDFVVKIAMDLRIAQILTPFVCEIILEKM